MAFGNSLSVGCGCCGPAEAVCPPTFHVQDCNGNPIAGAAVNISTPTTASGVTGADGNWTPPYPPGIGSSVSVTVAYDGVSLDLPVTFSNSPANCDGPPVMVCYDRSVVTVASSAGATIQSRFPGNPFPPPGVTMTQSPAGTWTFSYKKLRMCNGASSLPITLDWRVVPPNSSYRDACGSTPMACDGDVHIDATLYAYQGTHFTAADGACAQDYGCQYGPGPGYRGLVSKKMQVQWTSLDGSNYFADDEGAWITLDGFLPPPPSNGVIWNSDCRGPQGNFVSRGGGGTVLNRVIPPETFHKAFGSTMTRMTCSSDVGGFAATITYFRFGNSVCSFDTGPFCSPFAASCGTEIDSNSQLCTYCPTQNANVASGTAFGIGTGPDGFKAFLLQSPCDFTYTQFQAGTAIPQWKVHVRETT